jgi:uncharacterized protein YyaL (SSP411 family)
MNRLAREQSPYLLQHAANPVDWYPWGEDAFARARDEDKPIFLSVGYSTCHWCHVMEHESFEKEAIAGLLNRDFVSIKVDREERPDVDRVYMAFVQATTGSGGWPMSVWLTPDLRPFYGGTYYPPQSQWGRPGFADVLTEIGRAWREDRAQVIESAGQIVERLAEMSRPNRPHAGAALPGPEALTATARQFKSSFDRRRGGFGDAPKFPRPSELLFLLREHARTGDDEAREMVLATLRAMALGGMRDHIGGGFHRYSVDGDWRVPHFEKMLYDQAQLVLAYLEAAQASGDPFFAQIAEDTLQYVHREMTDPSGGFYSAEDADSVPPEDARPDAHKMEGAFYTWRQAEVRELLGDDSRLFELRYGVLPDGNAPFDPQQEFTGKNLLYTARGIADVARETGRDPQAVAEALTRARMTLFAARERRPRPHRDDKILTGWNGLMIAAFARAARVLAGGAALGQDMSEDPGRRHLATAQRAAEFIERSLWNRDREMLLRRYRNGDAAIDAYAEDYAFLIFGLVELFQSDGDVRWLKWARQLQHTQDRLFWDDVEGGWFSTTGHDSSVLVRMKEEYDGAEPSASGVGAWNLLALVHVTGEASYDARARAAFAAFGARLESLGRALPFMSSALSAAHAAPEQIVVVGADDTATDTMWQAANTSFRPFATLLRVRPGTQQQQLAVELPWIAGMAPRDGQPAAYVCRNFACDAPTTNPNDLIAKVVGPPR